MFQFSRGPPLGWGGVWLPTAAKVKCCHRWKSPPEAARKNTCIFGGVCALLYCYHTPHNEFARLRQQWTRLRRFATRGNIWILLTCRLWKTSLGFCRIENVCNKINCRWWKSLILHEWRYRLWPNCPVVEFPDSPRVVILPVTELVVGGIL